MNELFIKTIELRESPERNSYLNDLPSVKYLKKHKTLKLKSPVTFFVGENGTGKSTLLEAVAVAFGFNPEGGTRNFNFSTNETHSGLHNNIVLAKSFHAKDGFFLRAESFYNVATNIDDMDKDPTSLAPPIINSYGGISLHEQSHGESFMALVHNRFGGNGVYILDEPEAALSPMRIMTLMAEINALVKKNSQFIIATHSPILMAFPEAQIFQFSQNGIEETEYKQTEHYQLTRHFLENPEKMLRYILE